MKLLHPFSKARIRNAAVAAIAAAGTMAGASAQTSTWGVASSGLWSTPGNWLSGSPADGSGNTANFNFVNPVGDITVSLDSARTIGGLVFGDTDTGSAGGWILDNNGSSANVLTLAGGTPSITVNALGAGKVATISASIAGTAGFSKNGTGTLVLTSSNGYTGFTRLSAGTLVASDATVYAGATGTSSILGSASGIVTANNTALSLLVNGNNDASAQTISFKNYIYNVGANQNFTVYVDRQSATGGTGKIVSLSTGGSVLSNGTVLNVTGGNGFGLNLISLNVGTGAAAGSVTLNATTANLTIGNVTNNNSSAAHTLILSGTSQGNEITGVIANNGALGILSITKSDSSKWTFSSSNTYSGGSTINAGTLVLSGAGNLGSGNVAIASTGTLDIAAISDASFTLDSSQTFDADGVVNATGKTLVVDGTFNPGSAGNPGDLDVTGGFTLGSTAVSNFKIQGTATGLFDSLQVTGLLTLDGTLNLSTSGFTAQAGDFVDLFDWGTLSGTFSAILGADLGGGLSWDTSQLYNTGVITVVPEPGSITLLALGGTVLMALRKRKRTSL